MSSFESFNSFLKGLRSFDIWIITNTSSSVSEELLVDTFKGSVLLSSGFFNTILVVLMVLILRGMILIFWHFHRLNYQAMIVATNIILIKIINIHKWPWTTFKNFYLTFAVYSSIGQKIRTVVPRKIHPIMEVLNCIEFHYQNRNLSR